MNENGACNAASPRRIKAVLDGYVIVDDDIIRFDILFLCHIDGHFKVQDIACVVFYDAKDAFFGSDGFDALVNLVGRR